MFDVFCPFKASSSNIPDRWVSCIDLLGFSTRVERRDWASIFSEYSQCLDQLAHNSRFPSSVEHAWFSDTFLLYSSDDSAASFAALEQQTRWFISNLILRHIPLRGAMACGPFFAERESSIYLGQALVEAYKVGEKQDWIGFVLAISAVERLRKVGLPADQLLDYRDWQIPWKEPSSECPARLPALYLGGNALLSGQNIQIEALEYMIRLPDNASEAVSRKYRNSLAFLRH